LELLPRTAEINEPRTRRAAARVNRVATSPLGVLVLAATAASVGVVVIATGGRVVNPDGFTALVVWGTVTCVAAGLYWQSWRPNNRLGGMLVLAGFAVAGESLQGAANPVVFAVGVLIDVPAFLLVLYVLLAYPRGVLDRVGRIGFMAGAAYFAVFFFPWLLTQERLQGTTPLARCGAACPDNVLQVVSDGSVAKTMDSLLLVGRAIAVAVMVAALVFRIVRANLPQRRMLFPVTTLGLLWISMIGAYALALRITGPGSDLTRDVGFGNTMARSMLTVAFLLTPLQVRAFVGLALQRMLRRLEQAPTLAVGERMIALTLDDPALRVAFWLPRSKQYVGANGEVVEPPPPGSGLVWTRVDRGREPVAALLHSPELVDDPELLEAAGHALLLALNSRRLEHELRQSVDGLQRSRRLLLAADAAERRRLEHELHTTAQQHLVALRVSLELARTRADANSALAERLTRIGGQLDETVDELRRIASGVYSPLLEPAGLRSALLDSVRRSNRPLALEVEEVGHLAPEVETCVYFCVIEAVTNAVEHGGEAAAVRVRLRREGDDVRFAVSDDGVGFDVDRIGTSPGIDGIRERVAAIGGSVDVVSAPGRGTVVSGVVPLAPEGVVGRSERP
jgi:signal transduction histidine kinase